MQATLPLAPVQQPILPAPVSDLVAHLRAEGFQAGTPDHLAEWARAIDEAIVRRAKCGSCGRRGLDYRPMHHGGQYRVVGECPQCGAAEQF